MNFYQRKKKIALLIYFFKDKKMKAILFCNKRVGSTFLQKAINSHPNIIGIDEVFVNIARRYSIRKSGFVPYVNCDINDPGEYIEEVINKTYENKNTIFKLLYNQIVWHEGLRAYILNKNIPIIHLKRKNLFNQMISFYKMGEENHNPIKVTPKQLFDNIEEAESLNKVHSQIMAKQIGLTLYYENLFGETIDGKTYVSSSQNKAICDFFDVDNVRLYSTTKKKLKKDISIYLPNIEEIKRYFKNTKYEWMIK
jgi:hypothetical protein